ncbi:hypothetical protein ABIQ69_00245 [Agromyces sp. G08B096]|uniref:WXG100 family type VII secretion target n=1 Tax=Agromyces sp. G08B096 TaxID=3156399 RepID=A0AAU7W7C6_9MICO
MHDSRPVTVLTADPRTAERLEVAERQLARLESLADDLGARARALAPAAGRLAWRGEAMEHYDVVLDGLRARLRLASDLVGDARTDLRAKVAHLREVLEADAARAANGAGAWPTT